MDLTAGEAAEGDVAAAGLGLDVAGAVCWKSISPEPYRGLRLPEYRGRGRCDAELEAGLRLDIDIAGAVVARRLSAGV